MKTLRPMALAATLILAACQAPQAIPGSPNLVRARSAANKAPALKASQFAQQGIIPGEFIVRFRNPMQIQAAAQFFQKWDVQNMGPVGTPDMGAFLVKSAPSRNLNQMMGVLNNDPAVLYAEPNGIMDLGPNVPNDPNVAPAREDGVYPNDALFESQYAHKVTESQKGWEIQKGNKDVIVAIVDTGVDLDHPDLDGKIMPGYDFVAKDELADDEQGHGTHCAGIAAAITNNGEGVAGYAPNATIMPVRVLDARGSGTWADVASGIAYAAEKGAHVVSLSLGGGSDSKIVGDAVKKAIDLDSVVIAAMGNDGNNTKSWPAAYPGVVAVGATDSKDKLAYFSQYGDWISVSAPGVSINSSIPAGRYGRKSGTSMATPGVAGLAALVRSQFPELKQAEVKAHMEATADDKGDAGYDIKFGHGRVNVLKALSTPPARFR